MVIIKGTGLIGLSKSGFDVNSIQNSWSENYHVAQSFIMLLFPGELGLVLCKLSLSGDATAEEI